MKNLLLSLCLVFSCMVTACVSTRSMTVDGSILYVLRSNNELIVGYKGNDEGLHIGTIHRSTSNSIVTRIVEKAEFYRYYNKYWELQDKLSKEYASIVVTLQPQRNSDGPQVGLSSIDENEQKLLLLFNKDDGHREFASRVFIYDLKTDLYRALEHSMEVDNSGNISAVCWFDQEIVIIYKSSSIKDTIYFFENRSLTTQRRNNSMS